MPPLSVIIATYNRAASLRTCLEALRRQTLPAGEFEVLVVVDGSTDGTAAMLASLETPYSLRVLSQSNAGQPAAANNGLAQAGGEWCLFLDDDIYAEPGLLAAHLAAQREHGGALSTGPIRLILPARPDWFAARYAEQWNRHYRMLDQGGRPTWLDAYGGNLCAPRTALVEAGGFATDLGAGYDVELAFRLTRRGLTLVYAPDAAVSQYETKRGRTLLAGFQQHGAAAIELYRRHPGVLPGLLSGYRGRDARSTLPRRALLVLDLPPGLLGRVGPLLPRASWQRKFAALLQSYSRWRGVRRAADPELWRRLTWAIPILMYHAFGGPAEAPGRYVLPIGRFERQMRWIRRRGYRVISLEELARCHREYRLPPAKSVVITMDDGYADNGSLAAPVLRRYGFPATLFVVTRAVGASNRWSRGDELEGRAMLSWDELRTLLADGIAIGAHTRTHPRLPDLPPGAAEEEIAGSRADLERELGAAITLFAYPYGELDPATQGLAEGAGFLASCGVEQGLNDAATPLQALRRMEVYGTDSLVRFALGLMSGRIRRPR
jgi:glycosyltransferase involved in cell wall biosynthesis/peptidoglycan/xylan/chitin deacetylase (PgdA/CDA1 family)